VNYGEKAQMLEQYDKGHRNTESFANDNLPDKQFKEFLLAAYKTMNSHMVAGAPIYVFHGDTETMNFRTALKEAGFYLSQCIIWVKNSLVLGRSDYHWRHEPILYGWKEGEAHIWFGERDKTTVLEDPPIELEKLKKDELLAMLKKILEPTDQDTILYEHKQTISELHPTMKPIKLLGKLISNSSNKGDMVIDFFGGSGSTMIAAEQLERHCRMIELEPKYCDVIRQRWQEFTGQEATLLAD
jgi:DNA modification methylase